MASRVAGAMFALFAATLLAFALIVLPWWSGHPKFNGAEIKAKEIAVSPLGATGCNTGGDGACMNVPVDPTFETIGFALAGVSGMLAVTALALALLTLKRSERTKTFAIFVIVGAMISALLAIVLVIVGPKVRTEAPLPFDMGLYLFFGGIAAALAGSTLAMGVQPMPRMQLAPPRQSMPNIQPSPRAGVDVHALLAEDQLRPSSLGPEPKLGRGSPVHSPGGALPGPSGPLGASGPQPLFHSAPQLRPLYDATPGQGGTGGFVPLSAPNMPLDAPMIPRNQISAVAGIPTPASLEVQRPVTMSSSSPPAPPNPDPDKDILGTVRGVGKAKMLPPPKRPQSVAPIPPLVKPPSATLAASAVPPPPNPTLASLEDEEGTFDAMQTYQQDPKPRRPTNEMRPATIEPITREQPRPLTPRPPTRLATEDSAEGGSVDTDVHTVAIDEGESFDSSTNESTNFAKKPPTKQPTATMETQSAPLDTEVDDDDDVMKTEARPKVIVGGGPTELDLPAVRPPTETAPSPPAPHAETEDLTPPPIAIPPPRAKTPAPVVSRAKTPPPVIKPEVDEGPTERAPSQSGAKVPMSTAPDSLPPPSEKQQATSGPSPACPQCEAPMAWVEAHLRFYCKSCKMYF